MKRMICIIICLVCTALPCFAEGGNLHEALNLREVSSSAPQEVAEIKLSEEISLKSGLLKIFEDIKGGIGDIFSGGLRCVGITIVISFICSTVGSMTLHGDSGAIKTTLSLVGAIAVTAVASGSIKSVVGMGTHLIERVNMFSKTLLPSLAAAEAAAGLPGAAVVKTTAAVLFSDVLITLVKKILLPLMYINIFAATANAAAENAALKRISDLSVKAISATLKIVLGAFVSYITVSGIIAGGADRAGVKATKFAVSGAVPVVGGIISNATETVISGTSVIKNAIGVFGMLAILSAAVTPIMTLFINYVLFKFASVCASPMVGGSIAELTERLAQSFGLVLAMSASCITVILIAIIAAMQSLGVT